MLKPIGYDQETSINDPVHGSLAKSPLNDIYTIIYGSSPDDVKVVHKAEGFKRIPPPIFRDHDVIVGHNLAFDLSYILPTFKRYLLHREENTIWDCFPGDVEILTEKGWQKFSGLDKSSKVMQYNVDGTAELVQPLNHIERVFNGELLHFTHSNYLSHISTPTHDRVVRTYKWGKLRKVKADSKASRYQHNKAIISCKHDGIGVGFSDDELRFIVALQADGNINKTGYGVFEFKKKRKQTRLEVILDRIGLKYKIYTYRNKVYHVKGIEKYYTIDKHLHIIDPLLLSLHQKNVIINELPEWDGHMQMTDNSLEYYNDNKEALDKIHTIANLSGHRVYRNYNKLNITLGRDYCTQGGLKETTVPYNGIVYCVTVPSGMIVVRHNGLVSITGNCQYAEYLLSGQRHSMSSLSELQEIYLGESVKETAISKLYKKGIGADKIIAAKDRCKRIWAKYEKYCPDDVVTPLKIFKLQYIKAKQNGMLTIIQMGMRYLSALIVMQNTGINIDIAGCEIANKELKIKMIEHLQKAEELVAPYWTDERLPPFNVNSNDHKSAILFGGNIKCKVTRDDGFYKNGNPKTKTTEEYVEVQGFQLPLSLTTESKKEGVYCSDSNVIHKIYTSSDNEQAKAYCEQQVLAMNLKKMSATYLEAFLKQSIDGVLYPNFNHALTATGRLSSSNPNLQNVPSKGDMGVLIQKQFIAPEGYTCCSFDFSQLEIYVLAWLSGDKALTNDLLIGTDMHIKRLSYAEGLTYDEVYKLCKIEKADGWDLKRSNAKTISYQKAYGAGVKSLAQQTGLPEEVVQRIFEQEDLDYPDVKRFNDSVAEAVKNNQKVSEAKHFPAAKKKGGKDGKLFRYGCELLPIFEDNNRRYGEEFRHFGSYRSPTGRLYTFEEVGRYYRGSIKRGYSPQQMKNYPMQGSASDIVAAATAELCIYVLNSKDEVRMINTIHDSIWFYIKTDTLDRHVPTICAIMSQCKLLPVKLPFEIPVDCKIGANFGEMSNYEL